MRKTPQFLAVLIVIAALLGCRTVSSVFSTPEANPEPTNLPAPSASPDHLPALNGDWQISLTKSGGIMGMFRKVDISAAGDMIFTDMNGKETGKSRLPEEKLAVLTKLAGDTVYMPLGAPSGCADCFIFDLQISSGGETFEAQLNQIDLPASGLEPLVQFLVEELNNAGK